MALVTRQSSFFRWKYSTKSLYYTQQNIQSAIYWPITHHMTGPKYYNASTWCMDHIQCIKHGWMCNTYLTTDSLSTSHDKFPDYRVIICQKWNCSPLANNASQIPTQSSNLSAYPTRLITSILYTMKPFTHHTPYTFMPKTHINSTKLANRLQM